MRGYRYLGVHLLICCLLLSLATGSCFAADANDEEFNGPFSSWLDVKRDFGAKGDGRADDTAAIQSALDALRPHDRAAVLYFPAGRYRITGTLTTTRKAHQDNMVSIVGEHPSSTLLVWDGPEKQPMLRWSAWYAKISRLSFDGRGKASACIAYGPGFSTYNETSDIWCRDATTGILMGEPGSQGQAENEVLRCHFDHCGVGLQTVNWNSMDIWVWYCTFTDCGRGIHNIMGNWHAWKNLFYRSTIADVSLQNLMAFSVVDNTSVQSRRFLDFTCGHTWGSPTSITGNRILDPTGDFAMVLDNAGPYLVVDNVMRLNGNTRGIKLTWGDQTLVGNTYSRPDAVQETGRFRRVAEKVVPATSIADQIPTMPLPPPNRKRRVYEVKPGASAAEIQAQIDAAVAGGGYRAVVHLPMGAYKIDRTINLPANSSVQLEGDGGSEVASRLVWTGPKNGVALVLRGPSHAIVRDIQVQAGEARAIEINAPDSADSRVFADQLNVNGPSSAHSGRTSALLVEGYSRSSLQFRALQGSGNAGGWVDVAGSGTSGAAVGLFTGATGSAAGQYNVRNGGNLVVRGVYHEKSSDSTNGLHLSDVGTLSVDATRFSYATSAAAPTVASDSFRGLFTLATCMLLPVDSKETCRFELRGDGSRSSVLALGCQFWVVQAPVSADTVWLNKSAPLTRGGLLGCNINTNNKEAAAKGFAFLKNVGDNPDPARSRYGSGPLDDRGGVDDSTILRHLAPLRGLHPLDPAQLPGSSSDIRLYRVIASGGNGGIVTLHP